MHIRSSRPEVSDIEMVDSFAISVLARAQREEGRQEMAEEASRAREEAEEGLERARQEAAKQARAMSAAYDQAVTLADEINVQLKAQLGSLQRSNGKTKAILERAQLELNELRGGASSSQGAGCPQTVSKPSSARPSTSAHTRERRIKELEKEVKAAREREHERNERELNRAAQPGSRRPQPATLPAAQLRTSTGAKGCAEAPLMARTHEFIRRTVTESNCSLEGLTTCNALLMQMHTGQTPDTERLLSRGSVKSSFMRMGVVDREAEAAANAISKAYWALSSDAGNKGRAIQMMAISIWNATLGRPELRPLGAADLFGDQSAANGSLVHQAALKAGSYRPELNVAGKLSRR